MTAQLPPMTSIRGLGPLPRVVEDQLGPDGLSRLFAGTGLSPDAVDMPGLMIPLRDMVAIFERAAHLTGDDLIGLRVGREMLDAFGLWTRFVRTAPTLGQSLERIVRGLAYHQSGGQLSFAVEGRLARLSYHVPVAVPERRGQHMEHTLPALLDTFGLYLGQGWRPLRLTVDYARSPRLAALETALGMPVRAGGRVPTLVFPAEVLESPLKVPVNQPALSREAVRTILRSRPPRTLTDTIRHVAGARLVTGSCDLASVAGHLAMTPRTVQRRLRAEGQSFTGVVDALRGRRHWRRAGPS